MITIVGRMAPCPFLHPIPPSINPERQQDRAYDHHAFHEDAKPGDLTGQLGTRWRKEHRLAGRFWRI